MLILSPTCVEQKYQRQKEESGRGQGNGSEVRPSPPNTAASAQNSLSRLERCITKIPGLKSRSGELETWHHSSPLCFHCVESRKSWPMAVASTPTHMSLLPKDFNCWLFCWCKKRRAKKEKKKHCA